MQKNNYEETASKLVVTVKKVEQIIDNNKESIATVAHWIVSVAEWINNNVGALLNGIDDNHNDTTGVDSGEAIRNVGEEKKRKSYEWSEAGHNVTSHPRHYKSGKVSPIPGYYKPTGDKESKGA